MWYNLFDHKKHKGRTNMDKQNYTLKNLKSQDLKKFLNYGKNLRKNLKKN